MSTVLLTLGNSRLVRIESNGTVAVGSAPTAREAYCLAQRSLRCKKNWGPLHSLMDAKPRGGTWDAWKGEVADMQERIDFLEDEIAKLICPF